MITPPVAAPQPFSAEAVAALRADTPACAHRIHLNCAGAGLPSVQVLEAMTEYLAFEARTGPVEAAAARQPLWDETRARAAQLVNARPQDVVFASSCTHAWGLAFSSLPPLQAGDRVLVSRQEWGSNLTMAQRAAARAGATVETMPCRADGTVDVEALAAQVDARVRRMLLTWMPANGGLVNDAAGVGRIAQQAGVPLLVDAAQALGQAPVDLQALGCAMLVAPFRKHTRGPRGAALLVVDPALVPTLEPAVLDVAGTVLVGDGPAQLRDDALRLESGESSRAVLAGLHAALGLVLALDPSRVAVHVRAVADRLRAALGTLGGVTLQDPMAATSERSAIVSFTVNGRTNTEIQAGLARHGINAGANGVSYTPLDMRARGLSGIVRLSVSVLTTDDEIDRTIRALHDVLRD